MFDDYDYDDKKTNPSIVDDDFDMMIDCSIDYYYCYYSDENIDENSMMNSMEMTKQKMNSIISN